MLTEIWEALEAEIGRPRATWGAEEWELAAYRFENVAEAVIAEADALKARPARPQNVLALLAALYPESLPPWKPSPKRGRPPTWDEELQSSVFAEIEDRMQKQKMDGKAPSLRAAVDEMIRADAEAAGVPYRRWKRQVRLIENLYSKRAGKKKRLKQLI